MPALIACLALQVAGSVPGAHAVDPSALDAAIEGVARFVRDQALETDVGVTWPSVADGEAAMPTLYSGAPGAVLFLLEHGRRCGDEASLDMARRGALELATVGERFGAGLYTGRAGVAFTLEVAARQLGDEDLAAAADAAYSELVRSAERTPAGVRWPGFSDDVISGGAGIGLALVDRAGRLREEGRDASVLLATSVAAADELIAQAIADSGGLSWRLGPRSNRTMPGLSHGTAGVGLFMVELAGELEASGDPRSARYLAVAIAAGNSLRGLAQEQPGGGRLVHHSSPGNESLFYLGWCHGPVGTVRFFHALGESTSDPTWRSFADELLGGLSGAGLPEARPDGYWNNVGVCCVAAGIAQSLARLAQARAEDPHALVSTLTADVLARETERDGGVSWSHCEHRVRPDDRSTQIGLMQGASGIGLWLLEHRYGDSGVVLPDDPLVSPR